MPTVDGLRRRVERLQQSRGRGDPVPVVVHHVHGAGWDVMTSAQWTRYQSGNPGCEFITVREIVDCANG